MSSPAAVDAGPHVTKVDFWDLQQSNDWPIRYARCAIAAILLLSIVFPTALQSVKAGLLVVIVWLTGLVNLAGMIAWTKRRRRIGLAALFFTGVGLCWCMYGAMVGDPGAIRVMTVYVAYPLLLFFIGTLYRDGDFARLAALFRIAALLVIGSQLAFILSALGFDGGRFSSLMIRLYGDWAVVDNEGAFTLFTLPSVSSLMFLLPFLFSESLFFSGKSSRLSLPLFLLSVVFCMLAGRRAIYPVLAVSLVSVAIFGFSTTRDLRRRAGTRLAVLFTLCAITLSAAFALGVLNANQVMSEVSSIQKISSDSVDYVRRKQFDVLMREAAEAPIFGKGAGAAATYTRSAEQPWAYELVYVDELFQFGAVGLAIYSLGFMYLLSCLMRGMSGSLLPMNERAAILSFAVALIGFMVANATNPYLGKFDYMWVLFIPVAAAAAGIDVWGFQSGRDFQKALEHG